MKRGPVRLVVRQYLISPQTLRPRRLLASRLAFPPNLTRRDSKRPRNLIRVEIASGDSKFNCVTMHIGFYLSGCWTH